MQAAEQTHPLGDWGGDVTQERPAWVSISSYVCVCDCAHECMTLMSLAWGQVPSVHLLGHKGIAWASLCEGAVGHSSWTEVMESLVGELKGKAVDVLPTEGNEISLCG